METTPLKAPFTCPEVIRELSTDITTHSIHTIAIPKIKPSFNFKDTHAFIDYHISRHTELIHVPNQNFA